MNSFTQLNEPGYDNRYSAESLLLHTADGSQRAIEDLVPGFRTLQVDGRFGNSRKPIGEELETRNGALYLDTRVEAKEITVTYQLLSESASEMWNRYNRLKAVISKAFEVSPYRDEGLFEIAFLDKPFARHFVSPPSYEDPEPGRLNVVCSMTFYNPDPYIYSPPLEGKFGQPLEGSYNFEGAKWARVYSIDCRAQAVETITIKTGKDTTQLTGNRSIDSMGNAFSDTEGSQSNDYIDGDKVHLDCRHGTVTVNGANHIQDLTLLSAFPSLKLQKGEEVTAEGATSGSYIYRWRVL